MSPSNDGFDYTEQIPVAGTGKTVVDYLTQRYEHTSRDNWEQHIEQGRITVDDLPARIHQRLQVGQKLIWKRPPWEEPTVPLHFTLLLGDEHLLAVNKPAGLPTLPGGGKFFTHTLLHQVRQKYPEATPVHRLDRGTSGIVLFARTKDARRTLSKLWRERKVRKIYRAAVQGVMDEDQLMIKHPIGRIPHSSLGTVYALSEKGKPSQTHVRVVKRGKGQTLVEVQLHTGRPHQIRIHLASAGFPLVGETFYTKKEGPRQDPGATPATPGYLLHAHRLTFEHPVHEQPVTVLAPLPPRLVLGFQQNCSY